MSINLILKLWLTTTNCWDSLINILHLVWSSGKVGSMQKQIVEEEWQVAKSMAFYKCGSSSSEAQEGKTPSPSISRHPSFETDQVTKDFMEFLKNLQKPGREIHKQCRAFIVNMSSKKVLNDIKCSLNNTKVNSHVFFWSDQCCVSSWLLFVSGPERWRAFGVCSGFLPEPGWPLDEPL